MVYKLKHRKNLNQFLAGFLSNLSSFVTGTTVGWTSPVMIKLSDVTLSDSPLKEVITNNSEEAAWIASIIVVGAFVAPYIAGPLADIFGRKWTLLGSAVFFVISYIMLMVANEVWIIYLARIVQGFGVGFTMTVIPIYIGEISTDACRGGMGSIMQLSIVSGVLYVYAIGPFVSYTALQWFCLVLPFIFAVTFYFMPESPYYCVQKGRKEEAVNALKYLRGQSVEDVADEIAQIQASVEETHRNKGSITDIYRNKGNLKALIICAGLVSFQQLSGINAVNFNSQSIFKDANTGFDPAIAAILVGIVQVLSSCVTPLIVDRIGKKIILLVSAGVMTIGLVMLGAFFYIKSIGNDISTISWLPLTSLIIYMIFYSISFGPLPWAVLGEMFPGNIKSIASSIVTSTCLLIGFVVTRWYPALNALGPHYVFWLFGGFCIIAFIFTYFLFTETKGLSLQQIQDKLNGK